MTRTALRWLRRGALGVGLLLAALLALRIADVQRGPPLRPWHLVIPQELDAATLDASDWGAWMAAEARVFEQVARQVTASLAPDDRGRANRYDPNSPLNPARFAEDWNRSRILAPDGTPRGAVVLLHGLTDAPFSLRHVAQLYRAAGWVAILPRLPGHGTVPAGLVAARWEDWAAATRLAMREARRLAGPSAPLHLVGYSNGGALALQHALDSLENPALPQVRQLVLISPMIGVTAFARFAGIAALPALLPRFAKAAWLELLPEFNPFKYNSFPAQAAVQSHRLTAALQAQIARLDAAGRLAALPPVLSFQSVADATVSTEAVVSALYAWLPANGSALVLFDINRDPRIADLLRPEAAQRLERLLPPGPRRYRREIVTNGGAGAEVVVRRQEAGRDAVVEQPLGLAWPRDVFSLSHVALPFPPQDGLYGMSPDPAEDFGIRLGVLSARGERGVLLIHADTWLRLSSNPFFPYLRDRLRETLGGT